MGDLGAISLWLALALAAYSSIGSMAGKLRGSLALVESAQAAMYAAVLALIVSTFSLVVSFISRDFEISYVARHSDLAMPDHFTWVAFYAGNEGSLLYIAVVLSIMCAIAVWRAPERVRDALPYTTGTMMLVLTFFIAVMAFMANPFNKLPFVPADGEGINPLLTHFGMFFHPPALMAGLVGITIPFSFALGSLLARKTGDEWVDAGRVWGIVTWALLAGGLLLGSWWAYTILGWGGYWFWDPVENAAFMPWLALTAFIHSIMVQKRRGMFRMWNIALVNVAFGLALYGMFMNRGGSVPSVHSFGASSLGWVFLMFLALGVIVPFVIFFWRYPLLKSAQNLDSMLSREAAFLVNNLLLLAIAFVTLWGTVYPLISRLTSGEEITVARPFYDQVNGPLMLGLVFLMGIGPMLPWRRANWGQHSSRPRRSCGRRSPDPRGPAGGGIAQGIRIGGIRPGRIRGNGNSDGVVSRSPCPRPGPVFRQERTRRSGAGLRIGLRASHLGQSPPLRRLHRSPVGAHGGAGHRWHVLFQLPEGCGAVPGRDHLHRELRDQIPWNDIGAIWQPDRVHIDGRGVPGWGAAGYYQPQPRLLSRLQHGLHSRRHPLHSGGRLLRGAQRESARRRCGFPIAGQSTHLVDVGCRAGDDDWDCNRSVAGAFTRSRPAIGPCACRCSPPAMTRTAVATALAARPVRLV